jgi:molybdenum cofactor guanylyltransferase
VSVRRVSAIVLAGGRSSRFGRDKLAEPIDGRPLLEHAIEAVRPHAFEVLVVVAPGAVPAVPADVIVVHDPTPFEGPLAGLLVGLGAARGSTVLVTGGDMPELMPDVVAAMLASLDATADEAVILDHDGWPRPLPMAVLRLPALAVASRLVAAGERRLRALTEALTTTVIEESTWRGLDPGGTTMRDIDTPADLK